MLKQSTQVSVITPTLHHEPNILRRCLHSVRGQTYPVWEHLVCSDGVLERNIQQMMFDDHDPRERYYYTREHKGHYGAGIRQHMLDFIPRDNYVCFLDDDNILFPDYLKHMASALDNNPDAGFVISQTIHFGPLPNQLGSPPQVLTGVPVVVQNIDTIQVMVRKKVIKESGWVLNGYMSDGFTYQKLAEKYKYVVVPEVLSAHL